MLRSLTNSDPVVLHPQPDGYPTMLWTILIILAIVALAIWILARVRGGRV